MFRDPYDLNSSPILSLTFEAIAVPEIHTLHSFGEHELVDGTCGREGGGPEKEKVRNEEAVRFEHQNVNMKLTRIHQLQPYL